MPRDPHGCSLGSEVLTGVQLRVDRVDLCCANRLCVWTDEKKNVLVGAEQVPLLFQLLLGLCQRKQTGTDGAAAVRCALDERPCWL